MAPVLDSLSKLHVQILDGVGRVDDLSHFGGIGKKRDDLRPLPFPDQRNGRVFLAPGTLGKASKAAEAFSAVSAL